MMDRARKLREEWQVFFATAASFEARNLASKIWFQRKHRTIAQLPIIRYTKLLIANFEQNKTQGIHIHCPEGATPKDGPSAGIGMVTSIVSSITNIPARRDLAMTGEVTITGQVLPIGGLKEKLLAAHRAGIKHVIIPKDNEKDLVDIPTKVREDIKITPVDTVDEVLKIALKNDPNSTGRINSRSQNTSCMMALKSCIFLKSYIKLSLN